MVPPVAGFMRDTVGCTAPNDKFVRIDAKTSVRSHADRKAIRLILSTRREEARMSKSKAVTLAAARVTAEPREGVRPLDVVGRASAVPVRVVGRPHRYRTRAGRATADAATEGSRPVAEQIIRRALAVLVLAVATMMFNPTPASAHALLVSSSPTDGADLLAAPPSVTLTFDEQVLPESARLTLYSAQGTVLARSDSGTRAMMVAGPSGTGPATTLITSMPPMGQGAFALDWQVQSADDLHVSRGSIVFGVELAVSRSAVDRTGELPAAGSSLLRWSDLVVLALMLGSLLLRVATLPRVHLDDADRARWMQTCGRVFHATAGAAIITSAAVLVDAAGDLRQVGRVLTSTPFGHFWSVHLAGLTCVFLLSRHPRRRTGRALTWLAALAAVIGLAAGSHVSSGVDRPAAATLLGVHLAVTCGWAGSVLLLAVTAFQVSFRRQLALVLRAFAAPAAVCVALTVITGVALGARQVASADALISSTYGRILLVKVALTGAAALLGLKSYLQFRPTTPAGPLPPSGDRREDRVGGAAVNKRFARRAAAEGLTMVLILGAAATLSLGSPPRGPAFAPSPHDAQTPIVSQVDGLLLTLDLSPNTLGQNWARVTIDDTRRPARARISDVTLAMTGPGGQIVPARPLARIADSDRWQLGDIPVTESGRWQIVLTAWRPGLAPAVWNRSWIAAGRPGGPVTPILSDQPWGGELNLLALFLTVCFLGGALRWVRISRRRGAPSGTELVESAMDRDGPETLEASQLHQRSTT